MKVVITGGPGVGKTTLLEALVHEGYPVVPEAARTIIQQQLAIGGTALPWENKEYYTDLMLVSSISDYCNIQDRHKGYPCFFDRGIPDALCYAEMIGYCIPEATLRHALAFRYHPVVFILPPWDEIYRTDNERKQSWAEAEHTYHRLKAVYSRYGYEVLDVPKERVADRMRFVKDALSQ